MLGKKRREASLVIPGKDCVRELLQQLREAGEKS